MERRNDRVGTPHIQTGTDGETGSVPPLGPACESGGWCSLYEHEWGQKEAWRARAEAAEGCCEELTRSETEARTRAGQLQRLLEQNRQQIREVITDLKEVRRVSQEALKFAAKVKRLGKPLVRAGVDSRRRSTNTKLRQEIVQWRSKGRQLEVENDKLRSSRSGLAKSFYPEYCMSRWIEQ